MMSWNLENGKAALMCNACNETFAPNGAAGPKLLVCGHSVCGRCCDAQEQIRLDSRHVAPFPVTCSCCKRKKAAFSVNEMLLSKTGKVIAISDGAGMKAAVPPVCQVCQKNMPTATYSSSGRAGAFLCVSCAARIPVSGIRYRTVIQKSRHCRLHPCSILEYVCMEKECSKANILCEMCKCEKHMNHDCAILNRAADSVRAELRGLIKIMRGLCEQNDESSVCATSGQQSRWVENTDAQLNVLADLTDRCAAAPPVF